MVQLLVWDDGAPGEDPVMNPKFGQHHLSLSLAEPPGLAVYLSQVEGQGFLTAGSQGALLIAGSSEAFLP